MSTRSTPQLITAVREYLDWLGRLTASCALAFAALHAGESARTYGDAAAARIPA